MFSKLPQSSAKNINQLRHFSDLFKNLPKVKYHPVPRQNGIIMDHRTDRKVIEDGWKPRNSDARLRFELLDENDIDFALQYVTEHFTTHSNVVSHLKIKPEDFIDLMQPFMPKWIQCQNSVIVKDGEKIAGFCFGSSNDKSEFNQMFGGELFHENPKFVIKDDYAETIRAGPFKNLDLNRFLILWEEIEVQTGKFLPSDCQKLGIMELATIEPHLMKTGLATKAILLSRDIMKEQGVTHESGYCVATGTWRLELNLGAKTIYSLPYDKFLENGKRVYFNLNDGAEAAHVTLIAYNDAK